VAIIIETIDVAKQNFKKVAFQQPLTGEMQSGACGKHQTLCTFQALYN
jgi:hypothetical protein